METLVILTKKLSTKSVPTEEWTSTKAAVGTYTFLDETFVGVDRYWLIESLTQKQFWICAESPKGTWWARKDTASPRDVLDLSIPGDATAGQQHAVEALASKIGVWVEDLGANRGSALTPELTRPYADFWQVDPATPTNWPWCAMAASWAQFTGLALGSYLNAPTWRREYPLGCWPGAAYLVEQKAMKNGLWVPASQLQATAPYGRITGAMLVMSRSGSGSDGSGGEDAAPGTQYSGHVDLAIRWLGPSTIEVLGANLGDIIKVRQRSTSAIRGAFLFPLAGAPGGNITT